MLESLSARSLTCPLVRPMRGQACRLRCSARRRERISRKSMEQEQGGLQPAKRDGGKARKISPKVHRPSSKAWWQRVAPMALLAFTPGLIPDITGPASVVEAIAILAAIVAFHELGHFTAARVQGIHVSKFAIGFGPKLVSFKPGEVEYSVRALPLGGYVQFPDEDEDCPYPEDDPNLLKNRPILDRLWVISAGVVFNMILAFAVLTAQVANLGYVDATFDTGVRVPVVMQGSAAQRYGLQPGDLIVALDNRKVETGPEAVKHAVAYIKQHRDISVDFTVARLPEGANRRLDAPQVYHVQVLPDVGNDGTGKIGVQLQPNADLIKRQASGPVDLVSHAATETWRMLRATVDGFVGLISNIGKSQDASVSGPLAVVAVGAEVARSSPTGLYTYVAAVNINLAVVNALPLPALDGGYLLLLLVEAVRRGEKIPKELQALFNLSGFLLLTGAGLFLILKDTINLLPK